MANIIVAQLLYLDAVDPNKVLFLTIFYESSMIVHMFNWVSKISGVINRILSCM